MNTSRFHTSICRITLIPKNINVFMKQGENILSEKLAPKLFLDRKLFGKKYLGQLFWQMMTATCSVWDKERSSFCSWGRWQRAVPWFRRKGEKQGSQPEGEKQETPCDVEEWKKALRARSLPFAFGLQYGPFLLLPCTEYLVKSFKCSRVSEWNWRRGWVWRRVDQVWSAPKWL